MSYEIKEFGHMPDGSPVELYTLQNKQGLHASFTTLGGTWVTAFAPDYRGEFKDVVLGYEDVRSYLENPPHFGAIVGRNANRIGGASFSLNGKTYFLTANNGPNNLHSGLDFYRTRLWRAEIHEKEGETTVTFHLDSPHMDQGYPGNATISVSYMLTDKNEIRIDYHMVCDEDTIANFTNHSYFNLAGHDHGTILDQVVYIDGDYITETDEALIPNGTLLKVAGTPMDFTDPKPIGRDLEADYSPLNLAGGYDHNWVLNHKPGELSLCAWSYDPVSRRKLTVYTDLPGIQLYVGNFLDEELPGKGGAAYPSRSGYCFETQYFPDAINKAEFPSPVLKAGTEYKTTTIYQFSVE